MLRPACRYILSSLITGTKSEATMSCKTFPGPTDGSWSISPTMISLVPSSIALRSALNNGISTMDISSTMTTSVSSLLSAFLANSLVEKLNSRSLCKVLASQPVASVMRLAARPVGAASSISKPSCPISSIMKLKMVVLPVPGPPVTTKMPSVQLRLTASR